MNQYLIGPRTNGGEQFSVSAGSLEDAARDGANSIFRRKNLVAHRQTGSHGKSGMFQAYESSYGGALSAVGAMFHVMSA